MGCEIEMVEKSSDQIPFPIHEFIQIGRDFHLLSLLVILFIRIVTNFSDIKTCIRDLFKYGEKYLIKTLRYNAHKWLKKQVFVKNGFTYHCHGCNYDR